MKLEAYTAEEIALEAVKAERRRIMWERINATITSKPIDTTGDLFDRAYAPIPLFAPPAPMETR